MIFCEKNNIICKKKQEKLAYKLRIVYFCVVFNLLT